MRKTKKVDLGEGRFVEIKELTMRQILSLEGMVTEITTNFTFSKILESGFAVSEMVAGLTHEQTLDLAFSEVEQIESAFKEVNAAFLKRLSQLNTLSERFQVKEVLSNLWKEIRTVMMQKMQSIVIISGNQEPTIPQSNLQLQP